MNEQDLCDFALFATAAQRMLVQTEADMNGKTIVHFAVMDTGVHLVQDAAAAGAVLLE